MKSVFISAQFGSDSIFMLNLDLLIGPLIYLDSNEDELGIKKL